MTQTLNYQQMGAAARGQAHGLFAQTMAYVAATATLFALGAWLGRNLTGGVGIVVFIAAPVRHAVRGAAVRAADRRAARRVRPADRAGVAPTVADYGSMDPQALWQAGGATALFIALFGAAWRGHPA